jgi:hypothetical protein
VPEKAVIYRGRASGGAENLGQIQANFSTSSRSAYKAA